jgi:membrane protease YdiL (CAAX protease family)
VSASADPSPTAALLRAWLVVLLLAAAFTAWRVDALDRSDRIEREPIDWAAALPSPDDPQRLRLLLWDLAGSGGAPAILVVRVVPVSDGAGDASPLPEDIELALVSEGGAAGPVERWRIGADALAATVHVPTGSATFHRDGPLEAGRLVVELPADAVLPPATASLVRRAPLAALDFAALLAHLLAAGLLLAAAQRTAPRESAWRISDAALLVGFFLFTGFVFFPLMSTAAAAHLASTGATLTWVGAIWVVAGRDAPRDRLGAIGMHRIPAATWASSTLAGFGAAIGAGLILLTLPQGESPMTELLDPSAGILRVTAVALIAPWAEEMLFRGVLYGAIERVRGGLAAVAVSTLVFSLMHFAQHAGNLGPWLVVSFTGLVLSLVRWRTGSVLASTVAHLAYNGLLVLPVFFTG